MIIRLLLIALLVWLLFVVIKKTKGRLDRREMNRHAAGKETATMVRCAHCGLHIPSSEAVYRDQLPYCCAEHSAAKDH